MGRKQIQISLLFSILVLGDCTNNSDRGDRSNRDITYSVNGNKQTGFSYQIFRSGKLFIDQTHIPGVGGLQPFKTKEQAEIVAKLVVKKLNNSSEMPTIFIEELDSLNIEYTKL